MKLQLRLNELRYFSYHGVLSQERKVGTNYSVSVRIDAQVSRAMFSDDLTDTISYADIVGSISVEMDTPSALIEHVAGRIVHRLFDEYRSIERIELSIRKENPPGCGDIQSTEIGVDTNRNEWELLERERAIATKVF